MVGLDKIGTVTLQSKQIGKGKYDYLIGAYLPNEDQLVMGAKVSASPRITW